MAVQITQGTQTTIYTKTNGGTEIPIVKLDIGSGTAIQDFGGTILAVNSLAAGTISTGTISTGTIDSISQLPPNNWSATVNITGTALGTIKAAVAGSVIYITDLTISVGNVSNVSVFSGTSTVIAGTFYFASNGGVAENYRVPISTASGSALTYQQSGTGVLSINAQGFVR